MTHSKLCLLLVLLAGCSDTGPAPEADGGAQDAASEADASENDASENDASENDASENDGAVDLGGSPILTDAQRNAAAASTASDHAACKAVAPFYWEVGDLSGARGSGQVGGAAFTAETQMQVASASKWVYGAYAVQKRGGTLEPGDIAYLNFTSGYVNFMAQCNLTSTVDECLQGNAGTPDAAAVGKFKYGETHMEKHASLVGLGAMQMGALGTEVRSQIGSTLGIEYVRPQPSNGLYTNAKEYAVFLRRLLVGAPDPLLIATQLGTHKICTNHTACPNEAISSPIDSAPQEVWHYSLGHWVEDDPTVGDGAYSSAGALGFYPWVSQDRTLYGILARKAELAEEHAGYNSAACGRLIRKAWRTGTPVL